MWELDYRKSWALRNWCFWTVVLEKTLESPLAARRSIQSVLKEISPEYSLEGLVLRLKLQYFGHLMWRTDSLEKTLWLGWIEGGRRMGDRGWDTWMASPTWWKWVWAIFGSWWCTGKPCALQSMGSQRVGYHWATEPNWTMNLRSWDMLCSLTWQIQLLSNISFVGSSVSASKDVKVWGWKYGSVSGNLPSKWGEKL